jgi:hypothetical protein
MRWWWQRKQAPPPAIPAYRVPENLRAAPKDPGMVVEEIDTSAMTQTGVHKAWRRLTGQSEG